MSKEDERIRFTLRLPNSLFEHLGNAANKLGVSVNALILQILWQYIEDKKGA